MKRRGDAWDSQETLGDPGRSDQVSPSSWLLSLDPLDLQEAGHGAGEGGHQEELLLLLPADLGAGGLRGLEDGQPRLQAALLPGQAGGPGQGEGGGPPGPSIALTHTAGRLQQHWQRLCLAKVGTVAQDVFHSLLVLLDSIIVYLQTIFSNKVKKFQIRTG